MESNSNLPTRKYEDGKTDKETVVPLLRGVYQKTLRVVYVCPRCRRVYDKNITHIQYCSSCGQHIAPYLDKNNIEIVKREFKKEITLEELEAALLGKEK